MAEIAAPSLPIEIVQDPNDVAGNTCGVARTDSWDKFNRGWSSEEAEAAGRAAVEHLLRDDCDPNLALDIASDVAMQHPPLKGRKLAAFMAGAVAVVDGREVK